MINLLRFIFFFAAVSEGGLYLWDSLSPEMMATNTWSIQEVRLGIVLLSSIAFVSLFLWKPEKI